MLKLNLNATTLAYAKGKADVVEVQLRFLLLKYEKNQHLKHISQQFFNHIHLTTCLTSLVPPVAHSS